MLHHKIHFDLSHRARIADNGIGQSALCIQSYRFDEKHGLSSQFATHLMKFDEKSQVLLQIREVVEDVVPQLNRVHECAVVHL